MLYKQICFRHCFYGHVLLYLCDNFHLSFFLLEAIVRLTLLVVMLTPASMFMKLSRSFQIVFAPIFT